MEGIRQPQPAIASQHAYTLACFLIHPAAIERGFDDAAVAFLHKFGFDIIDDRLCNLDNAAGQAWYRPYDPKAYPGLDYGRLVTTLDLYPWRHNHYKPSHTLPFDNQRLGLARSVEKCLRLNWGHSTEYGSSIEAPPVEEPLVRCTTSSIAANDLVSLISTNLYQRVRADMVQRAERFVSPYPVIRFLHSWGCHACSAVVQFEGGVAFCKYFRPGRATMLNNEMSVLSLSSKIKEIPQLLDHGNNYFVIPFYENATGIHDIDRQSFLNYAVVRTIFKAVEQLHENGIALTDFGPYNVLVTANGIKLIDFESLCHVSPDDAFCNSPTFVGAEYFRRNAVPLWPQVKQPPSYQEMWFGSYQSMWYPLTGIRIRNILSNSRMRRGLDRVAYAMTAYARASLRKIKRASQVLPRRQLGIIGSSDCARTQSGSQAQSPPVTPP